MRERVIAGNASICFNLIMVSFLATSTRFRAGVYILMDTCMTAHAVIILSVAVYQAQNPNLCFSFMKEKVQPEAWHTFVCVLVYVRACVSLCLHVSVSVTTDMCVGPCVCVGTRKPMYVRCSEETVVHV